MDWVVECCKKVIENIPVISAPSNISPRNTVNHRDVLKEKGFFNVGESVQMPKGEASNVDISFYAEEKKSGIPMKVFASTHKFQNGKLVYVSTKEAAPGPQKESIDSKNASLSTSFSNIKERKQIRCRSSSPRSEEYKSVDKSRSRSMHTVVSRGRKQNKRPDAYLFQAEWQTKPSRQPAHYKSSSEISVSSSREVIYELPSKTAYKKSQYDIAHEEYSERIPKVKKRKEYFVIPDHTCSKTYVKYLKPASYEARSYESEKSLVVSNGVQVRQERVETFQGGKYKSKTSTESTRTLRSPVRGARSKITYDAASNHDGMFYQRRKVSPIKANSRTPRLQTVVAELIKKTKSKRHSSRHEVNRTFPDTSKELKRGGRRLKSNGSSDFEEKHSARRKQVQIRGPRDRGMKESKSSDSASSSTSSGKTGPFSPNSEDETEEYFSKESDDTSSGSQTSVCSISYHPVTAHKTAKKSMHHVKDSQKNYKCDQEQTAPGQARHRVRRSRLQANVSEKPAVEIKEFKTKRQINPNKVIHFKDDGKRISQHFLQEKATLDSRKAFKDEVKFEKSKTPLSLSLARKISSTCPCKYTTSYEDEDLVPSHLEMGDLINQKAFEEYKDKYGVYKLFISKSVQTEDPKNIKTEKIVRFSRERTLITPKETCDACSIEKVLAQP